MTLKKLLNKFAITTLLTSAFALTTSVSTLNPVPQEFRRSPGFPVVVYYYENFWELADACNIDTDLTVYGCYIPDTQEVHLPNPCYFPEASRVDSFAYLACHENGHVNGWRH